jgi:hypothetical protein
MSCSAHGSTVLRFDVCRQTSICLRQYLLIVPSATSCENPAAACAIVGVPIRFPAILAGLATAAHEETTMNRGDFIDGILVRLKSTGEVMTLGGTEDDWICTTADTGRVVRKHVQPDDVDPVINN